MMLEYLGGNFQSQNCRSTSAQLVRVSWAVPKLCEHFPATLQCYKPWKLFTDVGMAGRWVRPPERDSLHDCNAHTKFPQHGWVPAQFAGPILHSRGWQGSHCLSAVRAKNQQVGAGGTSPAEVLRAPGALWGTHLLLEGLFSLQEVCGVKGLWWASQEMSKKPKD